ncbi:F-box protein [Candidatus Nesciobacter abundans]|uniref:F-box domain-containing protein n=1 Tax=Candidatus Nesciobacter abundans TaxID=2601668 RepID=A0A5C0UG51_9PROT|nr:F-box protein [Candidatus Nesciobacter abundans]QEK39075.1 hypothetical protein FZC36_01330 [Candidatus Nesciobacter abundans]
MNKFFINKCFCLTVLYSKHIDSGNLCSRINNFPKYIVGNVCCFKKNESSFSDIPEDIIQYVCKFCDFKAHLQFSNVNKYMHKIRVRDLLVRKYIYDHILAKTSSPYKALCESKGILGMKKSDMLMRKYIY